MESYRFKSLLQNSGWIENAVVAIDAAGKIVSISQETNNEANAEFINGYALPAFQNAHSHAFQFAMAGLAENHAGEDDFWSWRELMYQLANDLDPEKMKIIARMLYAELVRRGYSNVAEFQYVHHNCDGKPFENLATMSEALLEAAREARIKITLVPIFYQKGGFGSEPSARQTRFISKTFEDYQKLYEAVAVCCQKYENANVAVGVHSLRAVETQDIIRAAQELPQNVPFHIHVAEQLKEVEDCVKHLGARPVEWLLDNLELNERFHLVHATHLTQTETNRLAKSGANVVLCPSTEGNLGDGIFPLRAFQENNGNWSIGTDSHIGLNFFEELRILDYGQRLTSHRRDTFTSAKNSDAGLAALEKSIVAGRRAMNNLQTKFFAVGADFDACIIDANEPLFADMKKENLASAIVFTADASHIRGTFVAGKLIAEHNKQTKNDFVSVVRQFRSELFD